MDQKMLENMLKMMASENDTDAVMGLRGVQGLLRVEGINLAKALAFILAHKEVLQEKAPAAESKVVDAESSKKKEQKALEISGTPQCISPQAGAISIVVPGQQSGEVIALPGSAAGECADIALHMKDALVAAVINKSRFKLKLQDIKNGKGEIIETVLQAEYEREGMMPVRIWSNVRGEVAALATVLRRAVSNSLPDLVAA